MCKNIFDIHVMFDIYIMFDAYVLQHGITKVNKVIMIKFVDA